MKTARLEAFLLVILLLSWQSFFDLQRSREYEVVEYFAGCARISRMAAGLGYRSAAMDLVYDNPKYFEGVPASEGSKPTWKKMETQLRSPMDLTTAGGFTQLGPTMLK